jgi:hypothetical protein
MKVPVSDEKITLHKHILYIVLYVCTSTERLNLSTRALSLFYTVILGEICMSRISTIFIFEVSYLFNPDFLVIIF